MIYLFSTSAIILLHFLLEYFYNTYDLQRSSSTTVIFVKRLENKSLIESINRFRDRKSIKPLSFLYSL